MKCLCQNCVSSEGTVYVELGFYVSVNGVGALRVSVRFFTVLREMTGKREEVLHFSVGEKVTVIVVLRELAQIYGKDFSEYVYDAETGEIKGFLQLFVNGKSVVTVGGLEIELADGDVLAIVPPVGGG